MSVFDSRSERAPEEARAQSPAPLPPANVHPVLALQATVGNRAVTALLQRDEKQRDEKQLVAPGGPVPNSPLVDAAVDPWINPKYLDFLKRYDNDIQGQHYSVVLRERQVWKSFAKNGEADVDVHFIRRRSLTKSELTHVKIRVIAVPLQENKWRLTATLFDWSDGFETRWSWESILTGTPGTYPWSDPSAYNITEIPPPPPPDMPALYDFDDAPV
jgi:hypothetical protein